MIAQVFVVFQSIQVTNRDDVVEVVGEIDGSLQAQAPLLSDDPEDVPAKSNGSLLGRKGLGRRNSLQAERSRTVSAKKPTMAPTKSEGTIQNPNLTVGNKRLSLRDLPKTNTTNDHLMPPPRVPLGITF